MARVQSCIFCGLAVRNSVVHVLASCDRFSPQRTRILELIGTVEDSGQKRALEILRVMPGSVAFPGVLEWSDVLDKAEADFWKCH